MLQGRSRKDLPTLSMHSSYALKTQKDQTERSEYRFIYSAREPTHER